MEDISDFCISHNAKTEMRGQLPQAKFPEMLVKPEYRTSRLLNVILGFGPKE